MQSVSDGNKDEYVNMLIRQQMDERLKPIEEQIEQLQEGQQVAVDTSKDAE